MRDTPVEIELFIIVVSDEDIALATARRWNGSVREWAHALNAFVQLNKHAATATCFSRGRLDVTDSAQIDAEVRIEPQSCDTGVGVGTLYRSSELQQSSLLHCG